MKQILSPAVAAKALFPALFAGLLFTSSSVFAQVKIGTNPTTINAANNLEVEASTAGRRTSIDKTTGQVTIKDGTEGDRKILTSDANGASSWVAQRSTSVEGFTQTSPGVNITFPPAAANSACILPIFGAAPAPCAVDVNRNASFSIQNAVNDVIIDATGPITISDNDGAIQIFFAIFVDKTTPGTFELVDKVVLTSTANNCSGYYLNFKTALKNLPVRSYNIKMYAYKWTNAGTSTAHIGIGVPANSICGVENVLEDEKIIVTVSQ